MTGAFFSFHLWTPAMYICMGHLSSILFWCTLFLALHDIVWAVTYVQTVGVAYSCTCMGAESYATNLHHYRKRGSASYIVREALSVRERERERERERDTDRQRERERERERERRKWRHHCRAKIGDEFTLSLAKNSHNWWWAYTFPCQRFALFVSPFTLPVSPFTERSPLWRWNSQWVHTFHCQNFFRPLCSPSFKWHERRDEWSKTQDKWSNPAQSYFVLPIEKNESN